jgi:hypothetical protein
MLWKVFYILRPEKPGVSICMDNDKILIDLHDIPNKKAQFANCEHMQISGYCFKFAQRIIVGASTVQSNV